jgi:hypothetical protein
MKLAIIIFLVLTAYLLNEYRLIRKYIKAIEKADKK